jgi:two-component system nitrate/nitrite response regulator NarL
MISAVFGDDHLLLVEAMTPLLARGGVTVVAAEHELRRVIEAVRRFDPDVCVLDLHFGDADPREAVTAVQQANPRTKIVVLTADSALEAMVLAVESGAAGYVHKTRGYERLVAAIEKVMRGDLVTDLPKRAAPKRSAPAAEPDVELLTRYLTVRERQCLALLVDGQRTDEMARRLGVSVTTVRSHVQGLMTKLGVHSRLEAASFAVQHDLVDPPIDDAAGA